MLACLLARSFECMHVWFFVCLCGCLAHWIELPWKMGQRAGVCYTSRSFRTACHRLLRPFSLAVQTSRIFALQYPPSPAPPPPPRCGAHTSSTVLQWSWLVPTSCQQLPFSQCTPDFVRMIVMQKVNLYPTSSTPSVFPPPLSNQCHFCIVISKKITKMLFFLASLSLPLPRSPSR